MIDIRLPNITASTDSGKLQQMQSYMLQLVQQLNWALNTVESAQSGSSIPAVRYESKPASPKEAEETFNSIKALIIKSADIVKAYETTIFSDFNGKYFAGETAPFHTESPSAGTATSKAISVGRKPHLPPGDRKQ